jgi:hypothetical protein
MIEVYLQAWNRVEARCAKLQNFMQRRYNALASQQLQKAFTDSSRCALMRAR